MLKIWICGAGGRVGRKMTDILASRPVELLLTDVDSVDITDSEAVMEYAHINRPHYIVNCAGLTDVAACEVRPEEAYRVNALGARNLSVAARMGKSRLVQMSTDDVFDGESQTPYTEFDRGPCTASPRWQGKILLGSSATAISLCGVPGYSGMEAHTWGVFWRWPARVRPSGLPRTRWHHPQGLTDWPPRS